jgi:hypothetical protein
MLKRYSAAALATVLFCGVSEAQQTLSSYVVSKERTTARLPGDRVLHLAIGLEPRDRAGLAKLAADVSDPRSDKFRHYQTLEQLTARFAPTAADYQRVIDWARSLHLTVDERFSHRMLVLVSGKTTDIEQALSVTLGLAKRADGTEFYKPDRAPSLALEVKLSHIAGLDSFFVPKHHSGTQLGGSAFGARDLRRAFAANCYGLRGAGEAVGITALGGYDHSNITAYEAENNLPDSTAAGCGAGTPGSAPCLNDVHIGGFSAINSYSDEATLDVEMAIAMAPSLHEVRVFEADPNLGGCASGDAIVAQMVAASGIKQFSTSNGICTGDNLSNLDMMAAMGETFFASSGDAGGALNLDNNTFYGIGAGKLIDVGGTALTMNGQGISWASEQGWKSSGGGIEVYTQIPVTCLAGCTPGTTCSGNCIPAWQHDLSGPSGASSTYRNDPDVSMPAIHVYAHIATGPTAFCGTSISAPLWAGFLALVNQQRCLDNAANCSTGVGFIDPLIYDIGRNSATYATSFHDVVGNSSDTGGCPFTGQSLPAVAGYDLASGWGSPMCGLVAQLTCTTCSGTTSSPGMAPSTSCVSFQSDSANCASCGNVCTGNLVCIGGQCLPPGTLGDTHITTLDGLYYDFQAQGDFLLITTNPTFIVQTRQVSGAPNWPNASVNHAVAMQLGAHRIALFIEPMRLVIDGKTVALDDGKSLPLPGGDTVARAGNVYTARSLAGETVKVTLNDSYLNVGVGLGYAPDGAARGLLGNGNGKSDDDLRAPDGRPLATPVTFGDLYGVYAEGLRVSPRESLFGDEQPIALAAPAKPFYAGDLDPQHYQPAHAACVAAGIKIDAFLDACTLDVAVIGSPNAVQGFAGAPPPVQVLQPGQRPRPAGGYGACATAAGLAVLLAAALVLIALARRRTALR